MAPGVMVCDSGPLDQERAIAAHPSTVAMQAAERTCASKSLQSVALGKWAYLSGDQCSTKLINARSRDQPRGTHRLIHNATTRLRFSTVHRVRGSFGFTSGARGRLLYLWNRSVGGKKTTPTEHQK